MKKFLLPLFLAFITTTATAQPSPAQPATAATPYTLPGSTTRIVTAPGGEAYRLFVHIPDSPPPPQGFPLLYVLDGADNFPIAVATALRLARAGARSGVEPGIIVGIDSGTLQRRARDYTPRFDRPATREGQPGHGLPTGGADAFLDFIAYVVQPALAKEQRIDPARIGITGHSFGGTLALHAALTRPAMFSNVTAASPSLWLADEAMLRQAQNLPQNLPQSLPQNLPARAGNAKNAPRLPALILTVGEQEKPEPLHRFAAALTAKNYKVRTRILSGEDHGSTMPTTIIEAVRAAFKSEKK